MVSTALHLHHGLMPPALQTSLPTEVLASLVERVTYHNESQGSEYPAVVIPLPVQHYMMPQRNLVYTGVTGGKRLVVLIGPRKAFAMAVKGAQTRRRWSRLREWLGAASLINSAQQLSGGG
jgi:hypothetical protein